MPTANERRALWFLAAVALSGSVVRLARSRSADSTPDPGLGLQLARVDSVTAARTSRPRAGSPKPRVQSREPGAGSQPVDLNNATAAQIEALPGIGPALAARIIAVRDSLHGFRDLGGLCAVRGVGNAMVERLRPLVTLSGERFGDEARCRESPRGAPKSRPSRRSKPR